MTDQQIDRRKSERINANLKLEVKVPREDGSLETATLETINISSSGVYFKSGHFIEPMTKLAMVMEVTVPGVDGSGKVDMAPVPCEGLVVRVRPETEVEDCDEYEVAVFFTNIESEGAANLEKHIALLIDDPS
ncbi:MAG: PilZ domain-containing protein [Candidatus Krumholzibacteria bacterium]|nr:PilZ domain-containing protein [Candidatus Krumholzibacteria bacterium]